MTPALLLALQLASPQVYPAPRVSVIAAPIELPDADREVPAAEDVPAAPSVGPLLASGVATPIPIEATLTSRFGKRPGRRFHAPVFHSGLDFAAPRGTPVFATTEGVVEQVIPNVEQWSPFVGYGNAVVLRHDSLRLWSFYAHLDSVVVHVGDQVGSGQQLGTVGNSSNGRFRTMGTHLHFELRGEVPGGHRPFPGGYGHYNLDPEVWLAEQGLVLDEEGHFLRRAESSERRAQVPTGSTVRSDDGG